MNQPTDPHTAWPSARAALVDPLLPGATDTCLVCGGPVEYVVRPDDRQRYGALAGHGGWRHQPTGHAAGDHSSCLPGTCLAVRDGAA